MVESENSKQFIFFPEGYHDQWCRTLFVDQSESFLLIALFQNHSGFYYWDMIGRYQLSNTYQNPTDIYTKYCYGQGILESDYE